MTGIEDKVRDTDQGEDRDKDQDMETFSRR